VDRNSADKMVNCTNHNASVTLRYALYRLQLAHAVGQCILRRGGIATRSSQMTWEDLFHVWTALDVFCTGETDDGKTVAAGVLHRVGNPAH